MSLEGFSPTDPGRTIDWSKVSKEYALYRPGPPESFYAKLAALDIGLPGQRILDLATGTGALARRFAQRGCSVSGIDIDASQIRVASELASDEGLAIDYQVGSVESLPYRDAHFDVATANQCWLYFDTERTLAELRRVLKPTGSIMISHLSWLPRHDEIARKTEALILKHNPVWSVGDFSGYIPPFPSWAEGKLTLKAMFWYDEPIWFTHESWRGRLRASRGVGASLTPEEVVRFDNDLDRMLKELVDDKFQVLHRIDVHVFTFPE